MALKSRSEPSVNWLRSSSPIFRQFIEIRTDLSPVHREQVLRAYREMMQLYRREIKLYEAMHEQATGGTLWWSVRLVIGQSGKSAVANSGQQLLDHRTADLAELFEAAAVEVGQAVVVEAQQVQ